jgi:hypothetical protein
MINEALIKERKRRYEERHREARAAAQRTRRGSAYCIPRVKCDEAALVAEALRLLDEFCYQQSFVHWNPKDMDLAGNLRRILDNHEHLRFEVPFKGLFAYTNKLPSKPKSSKRIVYSFYRRHVVPILRKWMGYWERCPKKSLVPPDDPFFQKLKSFCERHQLLLSGKPRDRVQNQPTLPADVREIVDDFMQARRRNDRKTCRYYVERYPQYFPHCLVELYATPADATDEERSTIYKPLTDLPEPSNLGLLDSDTHGGVVVPSRLFSSVLAKRLLKNKQGRRPGKNQGDAKAKEFLVDSSAASNSAHYRSAGEAGGSAASEQSQQVPAPSL